MIRTSGFKGLRVEGPDKAGVLVVTINRPEYRNAIDLATHDELLELAQALRNPDDIGAVLITGEGEAFSAGGDINLFKRLGEDEGFRRRMLAEGVELVQAWLKIEPPVVAAVNGHAMGLGATIALLSDVVYLADGASIADTHVLAGVVAGDGGALIWPVLLGPNRAKEFLMTGAGLSNEKALQFGLINYLTPPDRLMNDAMAMATKLATGPRTAIAWTKQVVNSTLLREAAQLMPYSIAQEARTMGQPDMAEATEAFLAKRKPQWVRAEGQSAEGDSSNRVAHR